MSLPLQPTLVDLRNTVIIRSGAGSTGALAGTMAPLIDELLRQSQRELYYETEWVRLRVRRTYALIANQTDYDIPDDMDIAGLCVLTLIDNKGKYHQPTYDDMVDYRNTYQTPNRPRFWWIMDSNIKFLPAPDSTWVSMILDYTMSPNSLISETDRCAVDGECLIQRAAIKLREQMGIGGDSNLARMDHERYLQRMRVNQGPSQKFPIASRTLAGPAYWTHPRASPYTPEWNPPGTW
jgi:hypothetical protein